MFFLWGCIKKRFSPAKPEPRTKKKTMGEGTRREGSEKNCRRFFSLPSPLALSPMSFSVSTSVQLLRSCNSYFPNHKRKNTLKNLQLRKLRGARVREGGAESKRNTETVAHLWKIAFSLLPFPRLPSPTSIFASPSPLSLIFALFSVWSEKIERL